MEDLSYTLAVERMRFIVQARYPALDLFEASTILALFFGKEKEDTIQDLQRSIEQSRL